MLQVWIRCFKIVVIEWFMLQFAWYYIILSRLIIIKGMNSTNSGLQIYKFELWSDLEFLKFSNFQFHGEKNTKPKTCLLETEL